VCVCVCESGLAHQQHSSLLRGRCVFLWKRVSPTATVLPIKGEVPGSIPTVVERGN